MNSVISILVLLLVIQANGCPFLRSEGNVETATDVHGSRRLQAKPAPPPPKPAPAPAPAPGPGPAPKPAPGPATSAPVKSPTVSPSTSSVGSSSAPTFQTCPRPLVVSAANTCSAYRSIKTDFNTAVAAAPSVSSLYGAAVRLAFHDAGEVDVTSSDKNGPDGCLSFSSANNGLIETTSLVNTVIEPMWLKYCDKISRADFWVLFAKLAIEKADPTSSISISYQYGRSDSSSCNSGAGRLPNAGKGLDEVSRVFVTQMGLTLNDAVALIGAHTLGHTHIANSGYGNTQFPANVPEDGKNAWDDTPAVFDNHYFSNMIQRNWNNVKSSVSSQDEWHSQVPSLMLNTDMSLGFSINTDNAQGVVGQVCGPSAINGNSYGCSQPTSSSAPSTFSLVSQYASSNSQFLTDFARSFAKMTSVGYGVSGSSSSGKLGTLTSIDLNTCPN